MRSPTSQQPARLGFAIKAYLYRSVGFEISETRLERSINADAVSFVPAIARLLDPVADPEGRATNSPPADDAAQEAEPAVIGFRRARRAITGDAVGHCARVDNQSQAIANGQTGH
jgi:hypothetical protein